MANGTAVTIALYSIPPPGNNKESGRVRRLLPDGVNDPGRIGYTNGGELDGFSAAAAAL